MRAVVSRSWSEVDDEFDLVDAWRDGDRSAGSELLRRQFDPLYRFFHTKVPPEMIGELIQQTLAQCVEKQAQFRKEAKFSTYVFSIARNAAVAYFRKQRRAPVDPGSMSIADLATSPSAALVGAERERLLLAGLRGIPFDHQVLLELHYWEQMAGPALARVLEVPEGTVRTRLRRAKQLLREAMEHAAGDREALPASIDDLAAWAQSLRGRIGREANGSAR